MIVVSDTTPINHLVLADTAFILPLLANQVIIPRTVFSELTAPKTPQVVTSFIDPLPDWIEIRDVHYVFDQELDSLGLGERDAIILAEEVRPTLLLMDEWAGREIAKSRGLPVMGTLGLVERAAEKGFVDLPEALSKLKSNGFFVSEALEQHFLARDKERRIAKS